MNLEENILSLIPQRPPFVMIDQLVSCNEIESVTTTQIKGDNVLVFNGEFSEAGLIENIAQTAAAGVGYFAQQSGQPILTGYIGAIKNVEIFALPNIGDVIETKVTVINEIFDVTIITGNITRNSEPIATCEMKIFIKNEDTTAK